MRRGKRTSALFRERRPPAEKHGSVWPRGQVPGCTAASPGWEAGAAGTSPTLRLAALVESWLCRSLGRPSCLREPQDLHLWKKSCRATPPRGHKALGVVRGGVLAGLTAPQQFLG